MTWKEYVSKQETDRVDKTISCGIKGCPYDRINNNVRIEPCPKHENGVTFTCKECWNREVPEKYLDGLNAKITTVDENHEPKPLDELVSEEFKEKVNTVVSEVFGIPPKILDSGNRTEFATGAVRDIQEGKGRCDLMPLDAVAMFLGNREHTNYTIDNICAYVESGNYEYLLDALAYSESHWDDNEIKANEKEARFYRRCNMLLEVAKHFEEGAKKYGENNWQKGIPTKRYIDSAVRHYLKFLRGDEDEPHDRAFVWNILCCIWTCIHKPELNDYRKKEG